MLRSDPMLRKNCHWFQTLWVQSQADIKLAYSTSLLIVYLLVVCPWVHLVDSTTFLTTSNEEGLPRE